MEYTLHQALDLPPNELTAQDRNRVNVLRDTIYSHKVLRINYTTYDMRRDQDSINPRTRSDIMVLSDDDNQQHPYWYARVIGIFHMYVRIDQRTPIRVDFLWVRWYGLDTAFKLGFKAKRLHRIGFADSSDSESFGFVNPANVLRAVHIIPCFALGLTSSILPKSIARQVDENDQDYERYYVNMYFYFSVIMTSTTELVQIC